MPGAYLYGWDADAEEWVKLVCNNLGKLIIDPSEIFEDTPTENEHGKAPTSAWAYGLRGTKYWSCPGTHFVGQDSDTDPVTRLDTGVLRVEGDGINTFMSVALPQGATVTAVKVYGNEAASEESWSMRRITLSAGSAQSMASDPINSEEDTIAYATINNSLYGYFLVTSSLDTDDEIWGARITYTL